MHTRLIKIDPANIDTVSLGTAGACIREGGLVAFPTETVYGLGANALDEAAVKSIFAAKGRPADNPLIVHMADKADIHKIAVDVPDMAKRLLEEFSPGPITLVFKKLPVICEAVTAGLDSVAVRIPSHPVARELIRLAGVPVAAPSANISGKPSPTEARHVEEDLSGKVDFIIDGGSCRVGVESTVVDVTGAVPVILRPGGITFEDIREIIPSVEVDPHILSQLDDNIKPKSPGMKYKHYSPKAEVIVVEGRAVNVSAKIQNLCTVAKAEGKKVGVMLRYESETHYDADCVLIAGSTNRAYASNLFSNLRKFDEEGMDIVFAEFKNTGGMGMAVRNRLYKAAGNNVINV